MTDEIEEKFMIGISSPDDLLATIPALLGFHPVDSVVVVGFRGPEQRLGMTGRVDVQDYLNDPAAAVAKLATVYDRLGISDVIVVFYGSPPDSDIERMFAGHGIYVVHLLGTGNEPHQVLPAAVEANAMTGRSVLPNREAVSNSIDYQAGVQADHLDTLLAIMDDTAERDRFITVAVHQWHETLPLLITACQATADTEGETTCNLLAATAAAAYRGGNGALAMEALRRSERIDSDHFLSVLLMSLVTVGIPPVALDSMADEAKRELEADYHGADLVGKWVTAVGVSP